jgi:hypothetical protein
MGPKGKKAKAGAENRSRAPAEFKAGQRVLNGGKIAHITVQPGARSEGGRENLMAVSGLSKLRNWRSAMRKSCNASLSVLACKRSWQANKRT